MSSAEGKSIEDIVLEAGLVSSDKLKELKELEERTGNKIEKILYNEGIISYKERLALSAKKMGVEFIDLETIGINKKAIHTLSGDVSRRYHIFPFDIRNNLLYLAMKEPDDIFQIDEIKVFAQMEIKPFLADGRLIEKAIEYFYIDEYHMEEQNKIQSEDAPAIIAKASEMGSLQGFAGKQFNFRSDDMDRNIDQVIRDIVIKSLQFNAQNIHLDKVNSGLRIRYRIDGILLEEENYMDVKFDDIITKIKIMAGMFTCDRNVPQKGRFCYDMTYKDKVFLEVLSLPTVNGEKLLLKANSSQKGYTVDELGFTEYENNLIKAMLDKKSGLLIVTGPGGSGRTTTAYALLNELDASELNIMTIERKPVFKADGINQIQYSGKNDEDLVNLLKAVSEHDADVIVVDMETGSQAVKMLMNTALSGKLIILVMSLPSVYDTLISLFSMNMEPYLVTSSINGIIAQHQIRKACPSCAGKRNDLRKEIRKTIGESWIKRCEECGDTGFRGKIGVFEVFSMSREYRNILLNNDRIEKLEKALSKEKSTFRNNLDRLMGNENTGTSRGSRNRSEREVTGGDDI